MTQPISLDEYYRNAPPSETEQRIASQKKQPTAQDYEYALAMMPRTDPRKQAATRALINGERPDYEKIWKEHQPA